ncbi:hypothetical protein NDU88_010535 [Pleurodeles waltl]|uniref:Uncharacterized protein n=1 Tax=Pleurodeles waltl TaxID=8319 RepID=A0AAV7QWQ5_PLEWA|nr:hypothetical protein NDU88_010535 [Pleurodeles waltl]
MWPGGEWSKQQGSGAPDPRPNLTPLCPSNNGPNGRVVIQTLGLRRDLLNRCRGSRSAGVPQLDRDLMET